MGFFGKRGGFGKQGFNEDFKDSFKNDFKEDAFSDSSFKKTFGLDYDKVLTLKIPSKSFEMLELSPIEADEDSIKKAYKKMSLKYHPDKEGGSDELFQTLQTAREVCLKFTKKYKEILSRSERKK